MPTPLESTARGRAVAVLTESYYGDAMGHDLLEAAQARSRLSATDAALAAEIVLGVSRWRITCEHIASHFYKGRWAGLRERERVVLAVGVYQLCWLDRVPEYAAVDETVKIAHRYGKGFAAVANAILRHVVEIRGEIVESSPDLPPRRYLPLEPHRVRLFTEDVLPDPARKPLEYLIAAYAHPAWLVERWHRRFKPVLCRKILEAGQRRPVLALRPNTLRITAVHLREQIIAELRAAGAAPPENEITVENLALKPGGTGECVIVRRPIPATQLSAVRDGLCQPQDLASQRVLLLDPPLPGQFVIDQCAGVGTKSTQAAELMGNEGVVLAADVDEVKLQSSMQAAARLGIGTLQTSTIEKLGEALARISRAPDLILVDAPCLNTGVLARRPEARYRAGQKALTQITELQRQILDHAASIAGPATRIIYSTCSLEAEENEKQVERFVADHPDWKKAEQHFTLPTFDCDGGFACALEHRTGH